MFRAVVVYFVACLTLCCKSETKINVEEDELLTDWIRITDYDGEAVIYNSCDMGNLIISINKHNNETNVKLHGEQEDVDFKILNITQESDTIIIQAKEVNSEFRQSFKFNWVDKAKVMARWRTQYATGHKSDLIFVNKSNKDKFTIVNQPCRECWGDECDE